LNCWFSGGEIPPKKLQALQKVLQSEFCNAIREVCNAFAQDGVQNKQNEGIKKKLNRKCVRIKKIAFQPLFVLAKGGRRSRCLP